MKLYVDDLKILLPPLDAPVVNDLWLRARFVDPMNNWVWYPVRFDGGDVFWGLIEEGEERVFDYFSLRMLQRSPVPSEPDVERDMQFTARRASELPALVTPPVDGLGGCLSVELFNSMPGVDVFLTQFDWNGRVRATVRFPTAICELLQRFSE